MALGIDVMVKRVGDRWQASSGMLPGAEGTGATREEALNRFFENAALLMGIPPEDIRTMAAIDTLD